MNRQYFIPTWSLLLVAALAGALLLVSPDPAQAATLSPGTLAGLARAAALIAIALAVAIAALLTVFAVELRRRARASDPVPGPRHAQR